MITFNRALVKKRKLFNPDALKGASGGSTPVAKNIDSAKLMKLQQQSRKSGRNPWGKV